VKRVKQPLTSSVDPLPVSWQQPVLVQHVCVVVCSRKFANVLANSH